MIQNLPSDLSRFSRLWEFLAIIAAATLVHGFVARNQGRFRLAGGIRRASRYLVIGAAAFLGILLLSTEAHDRFFVGDAARNATHLRVTMGAFLAWTFFAAAWLRLHPRPAGRSDAAPFASPRVPPDGHVLPPASPRPPRVTRRQRHVGRGAPPRFVDRMGGESMEGCGSGRK